MTTAILLLGKTARTCLLLELPIFKTTTKIKNKRNTFNGKNIFIIIWLLKRQEGVLDLREAVFFI